MDSVTQSCETCEWWDKPTEPGEVRHRCPECGGRVTTNIDAENPAEVNSDR